jgi:hypothetical protein
MTHKMSMDDFKNKIRDRELREAAKQAEEAFRVDNKLPEINKTGLEADSGERDLFNRAIKASGTSRLGKVKAKRYSDPDTVIEDIKFEYPSAAYIQIINLDKIDVQGYPEVHTRKIREVKVTASSTNSYSQRGRLIGAQVNNVSFCYSLVLVFVKDGAYKAISQRINGESNRGYY